MIKPLRIALKKDSEARILYLYTKDETAAALRSENSRLHEELR